MNAGRHPIPLRRFEFAWTALLLVLALGCAEREARPGEQDLPVSLFDLSSDSLSLLRQLPNVAEVKRHGPARPTHRIIHIADWHFVGREDFAADLRSQSSEPISDEEINRQYAEHLDDVAAIQTQQIDLLRTLIQQHGVRKVHVEGLAEGEGFIFDAKVSALRNVGQELDELRKEKEQLLAISDPDDETLAIIAQIEDVEADYHQDILQIGAAGRLMLGGELDGAVPLEDADAHSASNPVSLDGSVNLDQEKIEAREDAQARLLLAGEPVSIIILGGAHDLADNLERLAPGKAEYIRVEINAWRELTSD